VKLFKTNISSLSDEALMSRLIKSDDNKALTELYARYSTKLLGFFIKMFKGDVSKSQDFLQDIFVKIIEKKHLFDTERKFYSWVFTVANNMCMTEFRKPFIVSISSDHAEHENLVVNDEEAMDKKIFKQALKRTVYALEYNHKAVFILRFNEKFSLKEIADITEVSLGTVKSRLFYATKKISEELKEYNPKNDSSLFKIN
jgi:RNA polymerase sigma-70 factor (ECF subfamily)